MRPFRTFVALLFAACLVSAGARADDQRAQTREALLELRRAASALERGDTHDARFWLYTMSDRVKALNGTAQRYRDTARGAEQQCQARSLALISDIGTNYARQQELARQDAELGAEIRVRREQAQRDAATLAATAQHAEDRRREAVFRERCKNENDFYYANFGQCFIRVWEDRFTTRAEQINQEVDDLRRQGLALQAAIAEAETKQRQLQAEIAEHGTQLTELRARQAVLERQDRLVRLAIVRLSDVTLFWDGALSLLNVNVANQLGLLKDLLPTLDHTSEAPVFDSEDRAEIRSLAATLDDFAKSLDQRNNFLTSYRICR